MRSGIGAKNERFKKKIMENKMKKIIFMSLLTTSALASNPEIFEYENFNVSVVRKMSTADFTIMHKGSQEELFINVDFILSEFEFVKYQKNILARIGIVEIEISEPVNPDNPINSTNRPRRHSFKY